MVVDHRMHNLTNSDILPHQFYPKPTPNLPNSTVQPHPPQTYHFNCTPTPILKLSNSNLPPHPL